MLNRRWWDAAAVAVALIPSLNALEPPYDVDAWGTWATAATFLIAYIAYLRGRVGFASPGHHTAVTIVLASLLFAGTVFQPSFAVLQAFAYPFVWVTAPSTRRAIVANVALSLAVAIGYVANWGVGGILPGLGVAALSLGFSLALGLWITHIAEAGEEHARLLAELRATQGELAALHRDAGVTQERARLAREIHDTIAQSLTGLVMVAQRTGNRLDRATGDEVAAARRDVALIEEMARDALTEARGLVAALTPMAVDTTLADALGRLASTFERETGVRVAVTVELDSEPDASGLGRELEVLLLRAAQEGLANVRKHARADHAWIALSTEPSVARLSVRDDGVGPGAQDARALGDEGFGLAGLRDRLALAGGRVSFGAGPGGKGTELAVEVPRAADDSGEGGSEASGSARSEASGSARSEASGSARSEASEPTRPAGGASRSGPATDAEEATA